MVEFDFAHVAGELSHRLYSALLEALYFIVGLFGVFAGTSYIRFQGRPVMLYNLFFTLSPISAAFWGITLVGMSLALFFSIMTVTRKAADLEVSSSMGETLGHIGRSLLMFFVTPAIFISVLNIVSVVMRRTDELFSMAFGGQSIDRALFAMTARGAIKDDPEVFNRFATGALDYRNIEHVTDNLFIAEINTLFGIPMALVLLIIYFAIMLILIFRLFMLIVLYIVSPLFVSSMVLDDGAKYKLWRRAFLGKVVSGYSLLISVKIILYVLVPFVASDVVLSPFLVADIFLKFCLVFGGVYGAYKSAGLLAKIISPHTESDDLMVLGFAGAATVWGAKKAFQLAAFAVKTGIAIASGGTGAVADAATSVAKTAASAVANAAANAASSLAKDGAGGEGKGESGGEDDKGGGDKGGDDKGGGDKKEE